jgi:predicted phosphohydrolase
MPNAPRPLPLRILLAADLHYGPGRPNAEAVERLAEAVCRARADVLVLAGDIVRGPVDALPDCLALFEGFGGRKLFVPGNHELWTLEGDSEERYERVLPALAREAGFHMLDGAPVRIGDVGIVGNIGWYDYSLQDRRLRLREFFYRRKTLPGLVTMNDRRFVRWRFSDAEFTERCAGRLAEDLRSVSPAVRTIVAVTHFVPFRELVGPAEGLPLMFARAFLGSTALGRVLRRFRKVRHVVCGHAHLDAEADIGSVRAVAIGAGRRSNTLCRLTLPSGKLTRRRFRAR